MKPFSLCPPCYAKLIVLKLRTNAHWMQHIYFLHCFHSRAIGTLFVHSTGCRFKVSSHDGRKGRGEPCFVMYHLWHEALLRKVDIVHARTVGRFFPLPLAFTMMHCGRSAGAGLWWPVARPGGGGQNSICGLLSTFSSLMLLVFEKERHA